MLVCVCEQEALAQDILEAADVMGLFEQAFILGVYQHHHSGEEAHRLLTLKEFYSFAVKLQVFVDEKCGAW
jgi:hypothetical protein